MMETTVPAVTVLIYIAPSNTVNECLGLIRHLWLWFMADVNGSLQFWMQVMKQLSLQTKVKQN